jgi:hypothetical protein
MCQGHAGYAGRINGLTLIEVMLALIISTTLMAGLTKLYIEMHHSILSSQRSIHQNFSAMKVLSQLRNEIAQAGQISCAKLNEDFQVFPFESATLTAQNSLIVDDDKLSVRYQAMPVVELIEQHPAAGGLKAEAGTAFAADQLLIISDCRHAEIFKVRSVNKQIDYQIIYPVQPLQHHYQLHAEIGRYIKHDYYVRDAGGKKQLILEDMSGRHYVFQSGISELKFVKEDAGVSFEFKTHDNEAASKWYGYAEKT